MSRDWTRFLEDIAQSNVLINGLDQLLDNGQVTQTEYNQLKAQGCIFRAIVMFDMAREWGSFPIITSIAKTITAENVEEVYPTYFPPKNTPEESYAQIIADLEFGAQYAPEFSQNDRTIMTKTVAQAYLAKVYAERTPQNHAKVIEYADKVIGTAGLALEPNYETLWGFDNGDCVKRNTSEGILELHWSVGAGTWASWMFGRCLENPEYYFTWAKWVTPSRDLVSDFEREGDQIRLDQTVHFESCTWSNYYPASNYAFMYKLRSGYNNIYKCRLADIILIEAEAYAQGSGFACCIAHLSRQVQALGQGTFRHPIVVRAVLFVELKSHFIFRFKRSASPDLFTKRREMLLLHPDILIGQGNLPIQNVVDRIQVIGVDARRQDKQPASGNNVLCFHFGGSSWID